MKPISTILLFILLVLTTLSSHAKDVTSITLDYPPQSLANWYKPGNKRQVWLHTMFRLRRSMQALDDYTRADDSEKATKWAERLRKDYLSISEMVPEWRDRTRNELLDELITQIKRADKPATLSTLNKIGRSCVKCHDKSQAMVAIMYRSPDYNNIMLHENNDEPQSFGDVMEELPKHLNRILIAIDDNNEKSALLATQALAKKLNTLSLSCTTCHNKDPLPLERILGKDNQQRLVALQNSIKNKQEKESLHLMSEIGVNVCARCHGVHRTLADLRSDMLQLEPFNP